MTTFKAEIVQIKQKNKFTRILSMIMWSIIVRINNKNNKASSQIKNSYQETLIFS